MTHIVAGIVDEVELAPKPCPDKPYLTEPAYGGPDKNGAGAGWTQVWMCEPPAEGVAFTVVRQEWNEEMTVRTIYEIKLGIGREADGLWTP